MNEQKKRYQLSALELVCITNTIGTLLAYYIASEHMNLVFKVVELFN